MANNDYVRNFAAHWRIDLNDDEVELIEKIHEATSYGREVSTLVSFFETGALTRNILTFEVPSLWKWQRDPGQREEIPFKTWWQLFDQAHFTQDYKIADQPVGYTVRAYRGAPPEGKFGLAWSLDVGQAQYFTGSRSIDSARARVWAVTLPVERIYATYPRTDKFEAELTADVRGLQIVPVESEHELAAPTRFRRSLSQVMLRRHPNILGYASRSLADRWG